MKAQIDFGDVGGGGSVSPVSILEDLNAGYWKTQTLTCTVGKSYIVNSYYEGGAESSLALSVTSGATSLLTFRTSNSGYSKQVISMVFKATSTSVVISNTANSNIFGISCAQLD